MGKIYQLTYFDMKSEVRKKYMNGTGFKSIGDAKKEFTRIKREARVRNNFHADERSQWNIEKVEDINGIKFRTKLGTMLLWR